MKATTPSAPFGTRVKGVCLLTLGVHGDDLTHGDLAELVRNFPRVGFRPPVLLASERDEDGAGPVWGYVGSLSNEGDRLIADLCDVPEELRRLLIARPGNGVEWISCEIDEWVTRGAEVFRLALRAVVLHGIRRRAR